MGRTIAGGFLSNGKIAWSLSSESAALYASGEYVPAEGWEYRNEIEVESQDLAGCYRSVSRPAEDAGRS